MENLDVEMAMDATTFFYRLLSEVVPDVDGPVPDPDDKTTKRIEKHVVRSKRIKCAIHS